MTGARYVRAVLVTDGKSAKVPAALAALVALETAPDQCHVVVLGGVEPPAIPAGLEATVSRSTASTYSDAVDAVLQENPSDSPEELLWLLHDDAAPAPDALTRLEATARKRPRAAVVGAAHVRWDDASRLVNVGSTVSRYGARRVGLAADDDINQGQYDSIEDVLAVSLADALVARDAWERFGGLDPGYGGFGDSIDFCRRAWTSGRDVVLVPEAKVRHAQESLYARRSGAGVKRATHAARRVGEWYHALAWAPGWAVPLGLLAMLPSALARAVLRIAQNHPRLVAAELAVPFMMAARLPMLLASRRAIARTATSRWAVRPLLAGPRQVADHVRQRELGGWEQWRAERTPSDVVRSELRAGRSRTRAGLAAVVVLGLAASAALCLRWARDIVLGAMLTGTGVGATDLGAAQLWQRAITGWSEVGLGVPALDGSFAALMASLATVPGGLRVGLGALMCLAPLGAMLGAWFGSGAATRSPVARASAAVVYGLWPLFLAGLLDGRVGPVIAHLALPWVGLGIARATGWRRGEPVGDGTEFPSTRPASPSAALVAAIALAVATVAAPVLLLPSLVALGVIGALAGALRWRVWSVGLLPLVVGLQGLLAAVTRIGNGALAVLVREPGPAQPFEQLSRLGVVLGTDGAARWSELFQNYAQYAVVPGAAVLALALGALVTRARSAAVAVGWGVAALGVAAAAASMSSIAVWPGAAGAVAARGWPGAGSSLAAVGLLTAVLSAHGTLAHRRTENPSAGRAVRAMARTAALVAAGTFAAQAVLIAWPGAHRGLADTGSVNVLPLAVPLSQSGPEQQRALVLSTLPDGEIGYSVFSSDGSLVVAGRPYVDQTRVPLARPDGEPAGVGILAPAVAQVAVAGTGGSEELAAWGVGAVVVAPGEDRLEAALEQNPEFELVAGSERGTTFRVSRQVYDVPVSRAWLDTTAGPVVVPAGYAAGSLDMPEGTGGVLVIATPADRDWRASLGGQALEPTLDELGRQAFAVPSTGGELSFEYRDEAQRWWWWASAAAVLWALIGSIPLGSRGLRETP